MTKTADDKEIVNREVGERVEVFCNLDPSTVKELGNGIFEATITTSEVDRHNESIATEGIDSDNWEKNSPVVLYGHDYSALPIGKGISLRRFKNKMTAKFQLAIEEYPFAATVASLIKGGYLTAVSIGGVVKEWSDDYREILKMEMVEFSVVPIPANRSALITGKSLSDITGKSVDEIRDEFKEFTHKTLLDKVGKMGKDELSQSVKVLESLVATLKESLSASSSAGEVKSESVERIKRIRLREAAVAVNKESERTIRIIKLKG